jgi:hypothetical protein
MSCAMNSPSGIPPRLRSQSSVLSRCRLESEEEEEEEDDTHGQAYFFFFSRERESRGNWSDSQPPTAAHSRHETDSRACMIRKTLTHEKSPTRKIADGSHHHTNEGTSAHWRRFSAVLRPSCSIGFARTWGDRLHCFSRAGKGALVEMAVVPNSARRRRALTFAGARCAGC